MHVLNNVTASIGSVITSPVPRIGQGIVSSAYLFATRSDPQWGRTIRVS